MPPLHGYSEENFLDTWYHHLPASVHASAQYFIHLIYMVTKVRLPTSFLDLQSDGFDNLEWQCASCMLPDPVLYALTRDQTLDSVVSTPWPSPHPPYLGNESFHGFLFH